MSETTNPLLKLLRKTYGEEWNIRRSQTLWIASTRKPDSEKSGTAARHSLLKSSITLSSRNRRPLPSWSLTKSSDHRWFSA